MYENADPKVTVRCFVGSLRFASQVMNKMRRTGRREGMVQFGEKVSCPQKKEEMVLISRMTQRIFVGHHDETVVFLCATNRADVQNLDDVL